MKITQSIGYVSSMSVKQPDWYGHAKTAELTIIAKVKTGEHIEELYEIGGPSHATHFIKHPQFSVVNHTIGLSVQELYIAQELLYKKPPGRIRVTVECEPIDAPQCTCPQVHNASCALGRQQGLHTLFQKG